MYPQIVHIDLEPSLGNHVSKDMIHERLKGRRGITETKEHYGGFEETKRGDECCFPLVFLLDTNVVIAPSDIKLGEQRRVFHIIDWLWDEGERISVANGVGVKISIVLERSQSSILLGYEEKWRGLWGFRG